MKNIEIKFDKRNYRKHSNKNKNLINKSLKDCGAGRSIVIDNEDNIIAGNGIYEQAQSLGMKTKIIETDGSELVVVKRTDLSPEDEKRKQLAIMDNSTSDSSEFNVELLNADFDMKILNDWGIEDVLLDKDKEEDIKPEVEFTEELLEEHNYIVLYFDNSVDWLQAETLCGDLLKTKQALNSKKNYRKEGVGRVIKGAEFFKKILGN